MDASAIAPVVVAVISAVAALASASYAQKSAHAVRLSAADALALRFREPLLQAAFNLQTRIYNIVQGDFLQLYAGESSPAHEREYGIENTIYLFGQYFCWVEVLRRESQFLDPRSRARDRAVADQLERVRDVFASSTLGNATFRIFRGEQRAMGEVLLSPILDAPEGTPRWQCLGYAGFMERIGEAPLERWFSRLRADLMASTADPCVGRDRLVRAQHELLSLVALLDPDAERTSGRLRERLRETPAPSLHQRPSVQRGSCDGSGT